MIFKDDFLRNMSVPHTKNETKFGQNVSEGNSKYALLLKRIKRVSHEWET
jgi:hypothetical protein